MDEGGGGGVGGSVNMMQFFRGGTCRGEEQTKRSSSHCNTVPAAQGSEGGERGHHAALKCAYNEITAIGVAPQTRNGLGPGGGRDQLKSLVYNH